MWGSKKRRIAELEARVRQLVDERDEARDERDTERGARSVAARQFCEADAALKRVHGRNVHLTEQLETAREAAQDGALDEMGQRLDRALRACARYRKDADGQARLIRSQQQSLDSLYGLDTPAVAEGARWQQRRHDRIPGVTL